MGDAGLPAAFPKPEAPVNGTDWLHLRTGKHDVTEYDWEQYLDFADRHLQSQ